MIVAADVFVYFGDLSKVFSLISSRSLRGGRLIFDTEHRAEGDFFLSQTGRYSHSKKYIETVVASEGWRINHFELFEGRKDGARFISSGLYSVEF